MQHMRHISHLFDVRLCGGHRQWKTNFNFIRWPGSRKARIALDRAVGWMHLDDWKNQKVGDPVPYFRSVLATISRNAINAPGQPIVEQVLSKVFSQGFSATLQRDAFNTIHGNMRTELATALGATGAITPGFEDMLPTAPGVQVPGSAVPGPGPGPEGGGATERYALEEALGAAFIDYFNGYDVDDIREAFDGYGGTDVHIRSALFGTFGADFDKKLREVDTGGKASVAMKALAQTFGAELRKSITTPTTPPRGPLDPVFADLTLL